MKKVLIVLADGFEETEAIVPADVLKRLGVQVLLTGLTKETVTGAHGFVLVCDTLLEKELSSLPDGIMLPGGLPGATALRDDPALRDYLIQCAQNGKITAAICAAPCALADAGLLAGKSVTGYPGCERLAHVPVSYSGKQSETDGNIVTGKGPGAAFDFAFALASALGFDAETLTQLKAQMCLK